MNDTTPLVQVEVFASPTCTYCEEALSSLREICQDGNVEVIVRPVSLGDKKPAMVLQLIRECIRNILDQVPDPDSPSQSAYRRLDWSSREKLRAPATGENTLVILISGSSAIIALIMVLTYFIQKITQN